MQKLVKCTCLSIIPVCQVTTKYLSIVFPGLCPAVDILKSPHFYFGFCLTLQWTLSTQAEFGFFSLIPANANCIYMYFLRKTGTFSSSVQLKEKHSLDSTIPQQQLKR